MGAIGSKANSNTSQSKLEELYKESNSVLFGADSDKLNAKIDLNLKLGEMFGKEKANKDNFYENSVGYWDLQKSKPRREPDHISIDRRTGKTSSEYWYTNEGVYRRSNHWGTDVASCSWGIKGRKYKNEGVDVGKKETAFIKWSDLKPKGMVVQKRDSNMKVIGFGITPFKFKK